MPRSSRDESLSAEDQARRVQKETAGFLFVGGLILVAGAFNTLILSSLPFALFRAEWQLQFSGTFLTTGSLALAGALLLCASRAFHPSDPRLASRVVLCRRCCSWVAIACLLLIPVQLQAGVRLMQQQAAREAQNQAQWQSFKARLQASRSEQELRAILGGLPQPVQLPARLDMPLATLKQRLIAEVESRFNAASFRTDGARSSRWQDFLLEAFRNCLQSLLLAIGFAALAQGQPGEATLLAKALGRVGLGSRTRGQPGRRLRG